MIFSDHDEPTQRAWLNDHLPAEGRLALTGTTLSAQAQPQAGNGVAA
jgi:hypothetical protein